MKKIALLSLISTLSISLFAQTDAVLEKKNFEQGKEEMKKKLNLTPEQEAKLKEIRKNKKEVLDKRRSENKEFHKNLSEHTKAEIAAVLTPEQQAQLDSIKANRKAEMRERIKNNPNWKREFKGRYRNGKADSTVTH